MKENTEITGARIAWLTRGASPMKRLAYFIATVGGVGHIRYASGTFGAAVGFLLFLLLGQLSWSLQFLIIVLTLFISTWAVDVYEQEFRCHDDRTVVIDEVLGLWVTLWATPISIIGWLIGFLIFRALDIFKPFPANWIDRNWPGARGVIFDDLVSGAYGQALMRIGIRLWGFL